MGGLSSDTPSRPAIVGIVVTITDVAHEAGVSKTTVSYVISNNPRISKDTADRVRQAMRKLGYTVNHTARALSTSKTMTIGLQVNADDNMKVSLTRGAYLCELSDFARKQGYDLLLLSHHNGMQSIRDIAKSRKVDGLILMDIDRADPRIPVAVESEVPTVLLGIPENPMGLDEVDTDFERAAHELIDLFTEQHHQEIALLHTPEGAENGGSNFAVRFRQSVVREASDKGITLHVASPEDWDLAPSERLRSTLNRFPNITGLIIDDDNAVISAPQTFTELGMQVPEDLSVAVVVPDVLREQMRIPYTAIDINLPAVAQEAVDTLIRRIDNPNAPSVTRLVSQLLIRQHSVKSL